MGDDIFKDGKQGCQTVQEVRSRPWVGKEGVGGGRMWAKNSILRVFVRTPLLHTYRTPVYHTFFFFVNYRSL